MKRQVLKDYETGKIFLPQLKPVTVTRLIMIAVGTWNNFAMPTYLLTDATKATVIQIVRKSFYAVAGAVQNVPLACAMCAVALLPVIVLYILLQKYIIEGQLDTQQLDMPVRAYAIQSTNAGEDKTTIPEQAAAAYQKYVNQNKGQAGGVTK